MSTCLAFQKGEPRSCSPFSSTPSSPQFLPFEFGHMGNSLALALLFMALISSYEASSNSCPVQRCSEGGPDIRFPFSTAEQPRRCGYPGFELSCKANKTLLSMLPFAPLIVTNISYGINEITVDPDDCIEGFILNRNLSATPFSYPYSMINPGSAYLICNRNVTLFTYYPVPCLSSNSTSSNNTGRYVYMVPSNLDARALSVPGHCRIMKLIPYIYYMEWYYQHVSPNSLQLTWSLPGCDSYIKCGFKNNISNDTYCFDPPPLQLGAFLPSISGKKPKSWMIGISIVTAFLIITAIIIGVRRFNKHGSKKEKEIQISIEKFLEEYKCLMLTRYSYADIKKLTDNFKIQLGEGGNGGVFKGSLPSGQPVAVKIPRKYPTNNGDQFVNEVGTIGRIHHINVVRLLGFCADGFHQALIYEFMPNGSLEKFLFSASARNAMLNWKKLLEIATGVARGMEYLHQGCSQRILHFDIKPHNILLDHNFRPQVTDFGLAKICSKEQSNVSISVVRGTAGYMAPEVLSGNFGSVSYKSDVYSFGILLLELIGGKKKTTGAAQISEQTKLPEEIYNQISRGETGLEINGEEDGCIVRKLIEVALLCIQWYPVDRPSMKVVVQMLEGSTEGL